MCSNSYLENCNLYLKRNLGKKHKLDWISFIKFIKKEFDRLKNFQRKPNLVLKNLLKLNINKILKIKQLIIIFIKLILIGLYMNIILVDMMLLLIFIFLYL